MGLSASASRGPSGTARTSASVGKLACMLGLVALAACTAPEPEPSAPSLPPAPPAFRAGDIDGDGVIGRQEWQEAGEILFREIDTDGSADIDPVELEVAEALLRDSPRRPVPPEAIDRLRQRADINADGRIDRAEWHAFRQEAFDHADLDGNGLLARRGAVDESAELSLLGS
jgi:EF hand